jgi:hypothetical protein
MRKLFLLFAAFCSVAVAQSVPTVIGFIPNRASGQITLTSETCKGSTDERFVFVKDDGGKLSLTGCWKMIDSDVIVRWSDGDVYSYDVGMVVFTPAFNEWYKNRNQPVY